MSTLWNRLRQGSRGRPPHRGTPTTPQVDRLLDAARATGTPRELAHEDETVMLFHRARPTRAAAGGAETEAARPTRRGLQALVATGGVVAVMSSGIAFAASGHAPWSHSPAPSASAGRHGSATTAGPASTASTASTATVPTSGGTTDPGTDPATDPVTEPAARSHGLRGLCHAYAAGTKAEHGQALAGPAFA